MAKDYRVTLSSYYIGKYEVTQAQWKAVMGNNPSEFRGDDLPVESVSWDDVQIFLGKLNSLTGKNYRLPTEAEWEFAARGGNQSKGYEYSGSNNLDEVSWNGKNSNGKTHTVGTKLPNELDIYDMSGNVYEWCQDSCDGSANYGSTPTDGSANTIGYDRVFRGGSFVNDVRRTHVSYRSGFTPGLSHGNVGFRLACSSN